MVATILMIFLLTKQKRQLTVYVVLLVKNLEFRHCKQTTETKRIDTGISLRIVIHPDGVGELCLLDTAPIISCRKKYTCIGTP